MDPTTSYPKAAIERLAVFSRQRSWFKSDGQRRPFGPLVL